MSYTIVKDDEFYARQNENRLNAVVRHCRIGKVTEKHLNGLPKWMIISRDIPPKDTFFIPPPVTDISWLDNIVVGNG